MQQQLIEIYEGGEFFPSTALLSQLGMVGQQIQIHFKGLHLVTPLSSPSSFLSDIKATNK